MQEIAYEWVDFYPAKSIKKLGKFHFIGTASIHLVDAKMDLKGLPVSIIGKRMVVAWPWSWGHDHVRDMPVRYSHWRFTDVEAEEAMQDKLQAEIEDRILGWVAERPNCAQAIGIKELWEEKTAPKEDEPRKAKDKPRVLRPTKDGQISNPIQSTPKTKSFTINKAKLKPHLSFNL